MRTKALILRVAALLLWLMSSGTALAGTPIRIGINSQQYGLSRASVGARIHASGAQAGETHDRGARPGSKRQVVVTIKTQSGGASSLPPPFPSLPTSAPILRNQHPRGPDTFWYTDGAGHPCQYVPIGAAPCFTLVGPAANPFGRLSPLAVAESLARRVDLATGEIRASPKGQGLTEVQSWFWLDPAPRRQALSISLAGETVNVTADPAVEWRFGDGGSLDGGPGVLYRAGAAAVDAITHLYDTRCLPGDQGHDPYVLATCGQDGYTVEALVLWRITYSAAGPVVGSGVLPARTTESSTSYAVSESRAFLVSGGGQ